MFLPHTALEVYVYEGRAGINVLKLEPAGNFKTLIERRRTYPT